MWETRRNCLRTSNAIIIGDKRIPYGLSAKRRLGSVRSGEGWEERRPECCGRAGNSGDATQQASRPGA
jgi:hypothetical protein